MNICVLTRDHIEFTLVHDEYKKSKTLKKMVKDVAFDGVVPIACDSKEFKIILEYLRHDDLRQVDDNFVEFFKPLTEAVVYLDIPGLLDLCVEYIAHGFVGLSQEHILKKLGVDGCENFEDELEEIKKEYPWVDER